MGIIKKSVKIEGLKNKIKKLGLSKINKELLKEMNGQEIRSLRYEDVVGVRGNKVISGGRVVKVLKTNKEVNDLWNEYFYDEFGTNDVNKLLKEEFG